MIDDSLEKWGLYHINRYVRNGSYLSQFSIEVSTKIAVMLSFLVGVVITVFTVIADIFLIIEQFDYIDWYVLFFLIALNAGVALIELWILFHIGFQVSAHYINTMSHELSIDHSMKSSLVRAILEIEEPDAVRVSQKRKKKKMDLVLLLVYRMKVVISTYLTKVILKKLFIKSSGRYYIPWVSLLVTGIWDAWGQNKVLGIVRQRIKMQSYTLLFIDEAKKQKCDKDVFSVAIACLSKIVQEKNNYQYSLDFLSSFFLREFFLDQKSELCLNEVKDVGINYSCSPLDSFIERIDAM